MSPKWLDAEAAGRLIKAWRDKGRYLNGSDTLAPIVRAVVAVQLGGAWRYWGEEGHHVEVCTTLEGWR